MNLSTLNISSTSIKSSEPELLLSASDKSGFASSPTAVDCSAGISSCGSSEGVSTLLPTLLDTL